MSSDLLLGRDEDNAPVEITHEERMRHLFAVGKSGLGKSKFLEHCIRQDILDKKKPGLLLIDPHGELYEDIVSFCAYLNVDRTVHLFNPSDLDFVPCYNPLKSGTAPPDVLARIMMQGCAQVWGEDSMSTPLIRETLVAVFYLLIVNNLTLAEAPYIMSLDDRHGIREKLINTLDDYVIREKWEGFVELAKNARTKAEFVNQMAPADRRLFEFNLSPLMRNIFGQTDTSLNLASAMKKGDIVLVNLSTEGNRVSAEDTKLLGTLLLRDVLVSAKARNRNLAKQFPFYVYVDECYQYLTSDIEDMLDQTRKFGVHLMLACQRLGQLHEKNMFNPIIGGTETKLVFGGMEHNDVVEMAKQIYMRDLDLERGVEKTKNPMVVDQELVELEGRSETEARAKGIAEATATGTGSMAGLSTQTDITLDEAVRATESLSDSSFETSSRAVIESRAEAKTKSVNQQYKSILEDRYSTTWGLDKLVWEKAAFLNDQQIQYAVAYTHRAGARSVKIPFVKDVPNKRRTKLPEMYVGRVTTSSDIHKPASVAFDAVIERGNKLKETFETGDDDDELFNDDFNN